MTDFYDPDNDDGRGYEEEKSSKSKKWWWRDYDYDRRDYSYSKGSGSRSWMSKIGGCSDSEDWWRPKKDTNEAYQDLLNQLQNSANIIGATERGEIVVHWSNGNDVNDVRADKKGCHHIYLSPDNLLSSSGRGQEVSEEVLDAMTGKVYLASTLRETVAPEAYAKARAARTELAFGKLKIPEGYPCMCNSGKLYGKCCKGKATGNHKVLKNAITLWESIETSIARARILEDWKGFGPYIAGDAARSSASKDEVQAFIDASAEKPSVEAATAAIAWNLLNSSDPVSIPDCYDGCIEAAAEMMDEEIPAEGRFDACSELVETIRKILKTKKTDDPPKDGDDEDSQSEGDDDDGEGGGSEGKDEDDKDNGDGSDNDDSESDGEGGEENGKGSDDDGSEADSTQQSPSLCDSSLLGGTVGNNTNSELSEQEATEESSMSDEEKAAISAKAPDDLCDLGEKFDLVKVRILPHFPAEYRSLVSSHRSEIAAIRSSMMFRNSVTKMVSYGHRSGDIDENSLFKLRMDDDRVMTKSDSVSSKSIAICLLVDESGSMGATTSDSSGGMIDRATAARNVAVVIAESLRGMDGISVSIYGHTAEEEQYSNVAIREYYSPRQTNLAACMEIQARHQNHDSYAIMHTATIFNRDHMDYDRKIVFVISDGEPAGSGYGGAPARKHMLDVNRACQKKGVEVYGIGVDNAFSEAIGASMYGEGRFVILNSVRGSLGVMSRFIRQIAMR